VLDDEHPLQAAASVELGRLPAASREEERRLRNEGGGEPGDEPGEVGGLQAAVEEVGAPYVRSSTRRT
jgi:hypothetical protein